MIASWKASKPSFKLIMAITMPQLTTIINSATLTKNTAILMSDLMKL